MACAGSMEIPPAFATPKRDEIPLTLGAAIAKSARDMKEAELYAGLVARREALAREIEHLTTQLAACDAMLATLKPPSPRLTAATPGAPAPETLVDSPVPEKPPTPSTVAIVPPPDSRPSSAVNDKELEALRARADSNKRGSVAARVELAVLQCPDTFTIRDVQAVCKKLYGWSGDLTADWIASALWKLARRKNFRIAQPGAGRNPTVYSKLPA